MVIVYFSRLIPIRFHKDYIQLVQNRLWPELLLEAHNMRIENTIVGGWRRGRRREDVKSL